MSVWRDPPSCDVDIYPGLSVWDNRVSGSITVNNSRLPLWAFVQTALIHGWEEADQSYNIEELGFTEEHLSRFLYWLLEARGEFGRLICLIANAERLENDRRDQSIEKQAPGEGMVRISLEDGDGGVVLPPAWWEDDELRAPVAAQLRRCLDALEGVPHEC